MFEIYKKLNISHYIIAIPFGRPIPHAISKHIIEIGIGEKPVYIDPRSSSAHYIVPNIQIQFHNWNIKNYSIVDKLSDLCYTIKRIVLNRL